MSSDGGPEAPTFFGTPSHADWKHVRCIDCQTRTPDLPEGSYMKDPESHFPICRSCSWHRSRAIAEGRVPFRLQAGKIRDLVPVC